MRPLLVTAGATRNRVDAIRYLSAHAGGQTALSILTKVGLSAHFLGSAEAILRARLAQVSAQQVGKPLPGWTLEEYQGTRDLMARMEQWLRQHPDGVLVHSAAVGDYEVEGTPGKIPSNQPEVHLSLRPGPKIIDHVRQWAPESRIMSFKAGSPELTADRLEMIARAQRQRTDSDMVFANIIGRLEDSVMLVSDDQTIAFETREAAIRAAAEQIRAWCNEVP